MRQRIDPMEVIRKKELNDSVMKGFQLAYQRLVEKANAKIVSWLAPTTLESFM